MCPTVAAIPFAVAFTVALSVPVAITVAVSVAIVVAVAVTIAAPVAVTLAVVFAATLPVPVVLLPLTSRSKLQWQLLPAVPAAPTMVLGNTSAGSTALALAIAALLARAVVILALSPVTHVGFAPAGPRASWTTT
mmetsp:Transcript_53686/g.172074  ORF Transcript_53686/g.172074 Transcript_53686/m.172074 type:complete len:135 (-) Transcript_53686:183-587(-)